MPDESLPPGFVPTAPAEDQAPDYFVPDETINPELTTANQLKAIGEGLGAGAIPFFPKIEQALGGATVKEQQHRAQLFPTSHSIGQGLGSAAQMAAVAGLTGGLGAGAEGLEGVGAAAELADPAAVAADAIADGKNVGTALDTAGVTPANVSKVADHLVKKLPGKASAYAAQSLAGGASGGTDYLNESELGDHDFNGEAFAQHIGVGALMGAVTEGGINALGHTVIAPAVTKLGQAIDNIAPKIESAFTKVIEKVKPETEGMVQPALDSLKSGEKALKPQEVNELAENVDHLNSTSDQTANEFYRGFWPQALDTLMPEQSVTQVVGHAATKEAPATGLMALRDTLEGNLTDLKDRAAQLSKGGFRVDPRPLQQIEDSLNTFSKKLADDSITSADATRAAINLKRDIGNSIEWRTDPLAHPAESGFVNDMKANLWGPTKEALNSPEIFGRDAAALNQEINAIVSKRIDAKANFSRDFETSEVEAGQKQKYSSAGKLRAALNGDPLAAQDKLRHLGELVDTEKDFHQLVGKVAGIAGENRPSGEDVEELLSSIVQKRNQAQAAGAVKTLQTALRGKGPNGFGAAGLANSLAFGAHAMGASNPLTAGIALAGAAYRNPIRAMQMYAKISNAAAAARKGIQTGLTKFLSSAPAKAAVTGVILPASMGAMDRHGPKGVVPSVKASASAPTRVQNILSLADNPREAMARFSANTAAVGETAPLTHQAMSTPAFKAVQYLAQAYPKNPTPSLIPAENRDWEPSPTDLEAYETLHQAVMDPPSFLTDLHRGTATPEAWVAIQSVWPRYALEVQKQALAQVQNGKKELTFQQKLGLSIIAGQPVSPTVAPEQTAFLQQSMAAPAPTGDGTPPKAHRKVPTTAKLKEAGRVALGPGEDEHLS